MNKFNEVIDLEGMFNTHAFCPCQSTQEPAKDHRPVFGSLALAESGVYLEEEEEVVGEVQSKVEGLRNSPGRWVFCKVTL